MTITQSGPICDVCGKYILPFGDERVNSFQLNCIAAELHCCNGCADKVKKMCETQDFDILPDGPLKKCLKEEDK